MNAFSDGEVRAAVLEKARQLQGRHGSRVPADALTEGVLIHGQRVPLWNQQKGIFKPAVLGRGGAAISIQTSLASPYDDRHDLDSGRIVYKFRGTDPRHPDNAALRQARLTGAPLLYLVAVDPGIYDIVVPVYVEDEDESRLQFTIVADDPLSAATGDPLRVHAREYATRTVLQRLHQQQFRRTVLRAYSERCGICRLRRLELLDAAHILPDGDPRGEPVVSNGLGLCKIHHSAYDANLIGIDPDARLHVREDILRETDGPMLKHGIQEMDGGRLLVPRRPDLRPNRDFLAERYERFRAA
jgi:putative restriction endonuclease